LAGLDNFDDNAVRRNKYLQQQKRRIATPRSPFYGEVSADVSGGAKTTYGQTLFTILNMYVGGTMLQMGYAFASGGWIMLPLLILLVFFTTITGP
jgi:hypothetical protein